MDDQHEAEFHRRMGQPQVSVVLPVWNGERYLKKSIESILAQDFSNFELIIIDDGSTDDSGRIAATFAHDKRVIIRTQENAGVVSARNLGLQVAKGEFVAFLDADDIAKPDRLSKQVAYLQANPEVAVVGSHIAHFNDEDGELRTEEFPSSPDQVAMALENGNPLAQPAVTLRKAMAMEAGGYRAAFKLGAEDYDLWLRLSEKHPLANLPEVLTFYRIHPDSLTHRLRHEQTLAALAAMCAHRRRITGRPDPINGLCHPLTAVDLMTFDLSDNEEAAFMPSLMGLQAKESFDPDKYAALASRAWELRKHMTRGRLVRHCLAPAVSAFRKNGEPTKAIKWYTRAFLTEPLSACWILMR
jgi:hypothetical protein